MKSLWKIRLRGLYDFNKKLSTTKKVCCNFFAKANQCRLNQPPLFLSIIATVIFTLFATSLHDIPENTCEKLKKPLISTVMPKPSLLEPDSVIVSKKLPPAHARSEVKKPVIATGEPKPSLIKKESVTVSKKMSPIHVKKAKPFHPYIFQAASRYQLEPSLIMAVIMAESGYNPKAVSAKGAKGLMQLMPETAKSLGVEDIFNPEENVNGGAKYLKQLIKRYDGDIELALAAYNAGSSNVRRYKGIPPFKATQYYIKKVIRYHQNYKKQISKESV